MKSYFFICIGILWHSWSMAQEVRSKIINNAKTPIDQAYIINTRTHDHTHSTIQGNFSLENCRIGDSLKISHIGYKTKYHILQKLGEQPPLILKQNSIALQQIVLSHKTDALHSISAVDLKTNPVSSSQEILEKVPGLFIGQHAGGGKAEQIFLRGFDIDHGTDLRIAVDGMVVNAVSHAHGQGYADLHFVIPETIAKIDFGKGPYTMDKGNFATAGYVDFNTKKTLKNNQIAIELGQYNTQRIVGMFNLLKQEKHKAYIATSFLSSDGYFDSPQHFNRHNIFAKYSGNSSKTDLVDISLSYFKSSWNASGQIPQRAVDQKIISYFGAIDDTEGGNTSRTNIQVKHTKVIDSNKVIKSNLHYSLYDFELYSNFTFFLEDPIHADQIKQKEHRLNYGFHSVYKASFSKEKQNGHWQLGLQLRKDKSKDNTLSHTKDRYKTLENIRLGDIDETNIGAYISADIHIGKWRFTPSVRMDYFNFLYQDKKEAIFSTAQTSKSIISPKCSVFYQPNTKTQFYIKAAKGFHSNDTRVATQQKYRKTIPAAYGMDIGTIWKPTANTLLNLAYWYLYLEQEFVYVGDAGIVEPSGKTKRQGIELSYRVQPWKWLFLHLDTNYTHARAMHMPKKEDYIALAPSFTYSAGITYDNNTGFYSALHLRHIADRAANQDNSIQAKGYHIADFNMGYKWQKLHLAIEIDNLFNTKWKETQFATTSRLKQEATAVEEIHFTPGTPFFLKAKAVYHF